MKDTAPVKVDSMAKPSSLFEGTFGFPLFRRLGREFDEMFDRIGVEHSVFEPTGTTWTPAVEIFTKDNEFVVRADTPGMKKEDLVVEFTEDSLILRGERKHEEEKKGEGFYRSERSYGSFYRSLPLPEGAKIGDAKASVQDGTLEVRIPMAKVETKTRRLEITSPDTPKTVKGA